MGFVLWYVVVHVIYIDGNSVWCVSAGMLCSCIHCAPWKEINSQWESCHQVNLNTNIAAGNLVISVNILLQSGKKSRTQSWEERKPAPWI